MTHTHKNNLFSNLLFVSIFLIGLIYLGFLFLSSVKILPGFIMQILFLFDAVKFRQNPGQIVFSSTFIVNTVPAILLLWLLSRFFKSIPHLLKNIHQTNKIVNSLVQVKKDETYYQFKSSKAAIFTLGFFHPQIYLSTAIFTTHNQAEISAMLLHETNHQHQRHPLKVFIANYIKSFTPKFPYKDFLFDSYLTSVETSSDVYAESILKTKTPLVSALLKFQNESFESLPVSISYYNSQSERIKTLVGKANSFQKIPMLYSTLIVLVVLFSALSIKNSNIFYDCQHIAHCIATLISSPDQPLYSFSPVNSTQLPPAHCQ